MRVKLQLVALLIFALLGNINAQEVTAKKNPNALSAKLLFLDYGMMNSELGESKISNGLEISYLRNINRWINIAVPAKVGITNFPGDLNKTTIASIDGILQFQYARDGKRLIPYIFAGGGIVMENFADGNFQTPFGLGFNYELGHNSYLTVQGEYRKSTADSRDNIQYGLGYMVKLGGDSGIEEGIEIEEKIQQITDTDGDGVIDKEDECPNDFGDKNFFGCPDTDKDGIPDSDDECPKYAGPMNTLGCPDKDKDGIPDKEDECPELSGPISALGCPDSDGDGFPDNEDECPKVAGKKRFFGCPDMDKAIEAIPEDVEGEKEDVALWINDTDRDGVPNNEDKCPTEPGSQNSKGCPDSDGDGFTDELDECPLSRGILNGCPDSDKDGVNDAKDNCPDEAGSIVTNGCPDKSAIADEDLAIFVNATREIRFELASNVLEKSSYEVLDEIVETMSRYPNYRLMIEGHTDDQGDNSKNQILSENRAKACYNYLVKSGVSPLNIQYIGYGEMRPVADNKTKRGRSLNRRVEFSLEMK